MSESIIDQAAFDGLIEMVGDDFVGELVETFLEDAPELFAQMNQALDDGDAESFRRAAHSLKSNSASFGAMQLSSQAREMEYLGRDEKLDEARPKMAQLETAYEQAAAALRAYTEGGPV